MVDTRFFYLAFASLLAFALVGSYVLGADSWMAYLLVLPAILILRGLKEVSVHGAAPMGEDAHRSDGRFPSLRVGVALVVLSVPAALVIEVLGLTGVAMWIVALPTMVLVTLFDREYFGWADPRADANPSQTA